MKGLAKVQPDQDLLREYDFTHGERGKYANRYAEGSNIVLLDPDVAKVFPDSESVNQVLRALADIVRTQCAKTGN